SKQAKNEESTSPKSKFLELKPFDSPSSSKPSSNLELKILCFKMDHLTSLVEITDQLSDSPFCRFHRCLALSFNIVMFGSLGDIAQHTGTKGEDKIFWQLTEWVRRFSDLHFFILSAAFVPFLPSSVHAFPQTPNT
ncbi:hypothetical protein H5410_046539, partial [Solanum commersonii]